MRKLEWREIKSGGAYSAEANAASRWSAKLNWSLVSGAIDATARVTV